MLGNFLKLYTRPCSPWVIAYRTSRANFAQWYGDITFRPYVGMTDESRNCVSNIRPEGMNFHIATEKTLYLLTEMKTKKLSGVTLKDEYNEGLFLI